MPQLANKIKQFDACGQAWLIHVIPLTDPKDECNSSTNLAALMN